MNNNVEYSITMYTASTPGPGSEDTIARTAVPWNCVANWFVLWLAFFCLAAGGGGLRGLSYNRHTTYEWVLKLCPHCSI